jgi:hypothetical protein
MGTTVRSTVEIQMALKGAAALASGVAGVGKSFDGLRAKASALFFIEQQARQAALGVNALQTAAVNTAGVGFLKLRQGAEVAGKSAAKSIGLARHEMLNLGYQVQDIGVSLASGQSPLLVLVQQGSQIYQVLVGSKAGVVGAFAQLKTSLWSLGAAPLLAVAAGVTAIATAWQGLNLVLDQGNAEKADRDLGTQNSRRLKQLRDQVALQIKSGALTKEQGEGFITKINAQIGAETFTASEALNRITRQLRTNDLNFAASSKLKRATQEADLEWAKAAGDLLVAHEKDRYDAGEISFKEYLAAKRDALDTAYNVETDLLSAQLKDFQTQIQDAGTTADKIMVQTQMEPLRVRAEILKRTYVEAVRSIQIEWEKSQIGSGGTGPLVPLFAALEAWKKGALAASKLAFDTLDFKLSQLQSRLAAINGNPLLTKEQKRQQRLAIAPGLGDATSAKIDYVQGAISNTTDEAAKLEYQRQLNELLKEQADIQIQLSEDTARGSFMGNLKLQAIELADQWGNLNATLSTTVIDTVKSSVSGLANALTAVIMGTQKAGAAFAQFGISLLTNFIAAILQAILWATIAIPILTALGILSGGSTVGPGLGLTLGALAAGSAAASGITGRESGGQMIAGLPYVVGESRAEVMVPKTDATVYSSRGAYNAAAMNPSGGGQGSGGSDRTVYVVANTRDATRLAMRRGEFDAQIVEAHHRNRTELGFV